MQMQSILSKHCIDAYGSGQYDTRIYYRGMAQGEQNLTPQQCMPEKYKQRSSRIFRCSDHSVLSRSCTYGDLHLSHSMAELSKAHGSGQVSHVSRSYIDNLMHAVLAKKDKTNKVRHQFAMHENGLMQTCCQKSNESRRKHGNKNEEMINGCGVKPVGEPRKGPFTRWHDTDGKVSMIENESCTFNVGFAIEQEKLLNSEEYLCYDFPHREHNEGSIPQRRDAHGKNGIDSSVNESGWINFNKAFSKEHMVLAIKYCPFTLGYQYWQHVKDACDVKDLLQLSPYAQEIANLKQKQREIERDLIS